MKAVQLPAKVAEKITGATHYVQMDKDEKPPVEEVIAFARMNGASHTEDEEMFLVCLCDEGQFCGMNRHTLNAGLTE